MTKYDWNVELIADAAGAIRGTEIHSLAEFYASRACYPPSTNGAVAAITWHVVYHSGQTPRGIRSSRGHSYIVETRNGDYTCRVNNPYDHRNGVTGFAVLSA